MKSKAGTDTEFFRTEKIPKILLQIAPPVMLAQLIQAMYNIVDSFFVGKYSESALTALSVIYPLQLIIIALAVGTGVGVNTYMARLYAQKMPGQAEETAPSMAIRRTSGAWNLVYICHFLDLLYASVCPDKCEYPGSDRECCYLRTDRLYRQHRGISGRKLDEGPSVAGQYAPSDGRPDRGGADEYRA